jgi:hypothetical protein
MKPLKIALFASLSCMPFSMSASAEEVTYQVCADIPNTKIQQFFWERDIPHGGCQPEKHDRPGSAGPIILYPHNASAAGDNNRVSIPWEHFKGKTTLKVRAIVRETERCDRLGDQYVKAKFLIEKTNVVNGQSETSTIELPTCLPK